MRKLALALITLILFFTSCKTLNSTAKKENSLNGNWDLNYISGTKTEFKELYPSQVPIIIIDLKENKYSGNNSCNRLSGNFSFTKNKINFDMSKTAMTMMVCEGDGDEVFMNVLGEIDTYKISDKGKKLSFFKGDLEMMRFEKR